MNITTTKDTAIEILRLLSFGLVRGIGEPKEGKMCVEAVVCFALGLPHGDKPPCVALSVRAFKIALNDSFWSSNTTRANGLRRLAIAQLGSNGIDESIFVKELALATIKQIVPIALRAVANIQKDNTMLEVCAVACEQSIDLTTGIVAARSAEFEAELEAKRSAEATRSTEAARSAWSAVRSAMSAARSAELAESVRSVELAARAGVRSEESVRLARLVTRPAELAKSAEDNVLCLMAEAGVQALIVAKSPGCKWLSLIE